MVKHFAQRRQSAVFLLVCLCIAALCACTGCSSKKAPPSQPQIDKGAKRKPKSKATQRPYVIKGITYIPIPSASGYRESGIASWYGEPFHGRRTSNGEIYDMYGDTAAHKTLPMDTMLLVKNLDNGRSTVVRVNDRGPFVRERIIDLSFTKAKELGVVGKGTARVEIVALEERDAGELLEVAGQRFAADVAAFNPVFDVTPADLIDVIVTEKGVVERPDTAKLAKLMCRKRLH